GNVRRHNGRGVTELSSVEPQNNRRAVRDLLRLRQPLERVEIERLARSLNGPVAPDPLPVLPVGRRISPQLDNGLNVPPLSRRTRCLYHRRSRTLLSLEVVLVGRLTMEEKEAPVILHPAFRNGPSTLHRALGNRPGPRLIGRRNLERPGVR